MTATEMPMFLLIYTDALGVEFERLVKAAKPTEAMHHAIGVKRATAGDVARVLGAGGKVEAVGE